MDLSKGKIKRLEKKTEYDELATLIKTNLMKKDELEDETADIEVAENAPQILIETQIPAEPVKKELKLFKPISLDKEVEANLETDKDKIEKLTEHLKLMQERIDALNQEKNLNSTDLKHVKIPPTLAEENEAVKTVVLPHIEMQSPQQIASARVTDSDEQIRDIINILIEKANFIKVLLAVVEDMNNDGDLSPKQYDTLKKRIMRSLKREEL